MAFVKQTMANAAGYFFDLALETTVPELKAAKDFLQKMAADLNRFNMSSCQAAKAMVDSVASLWGSQNRPKAIVAIESVSAIRFLRRRRACILRRDSASAAVVCISTIAISVLLAT